MLGAPSSDIYAGQTPASFSVINLVIESELANGSKNHCFETNFASPYRVNG